MQTLGWVAGRILSSIVTMLGISLLVFLAVHAMPGQYSDLVLGPLNSPDERSRLADEYGLDDNLLEQYWQWITQVLQGNLGTSFTSGVPVWEEFSQRLPVTISLTALTLALTFCIGLPLGVWAGTRGTAGGALSRLVSGIGVSLPDFVIGSLVVFLFSRYSLGLSIGDFEPLSDSVVGSVRSLILPAVVLSVFCIAATARTARDAVLGVLVEPHITAAMARGESRRFIVRHHVLRNATIPIMTLTATITAYLLGGAIIVESVFDIPGMGGYLVLALDRRDYPVILGGVLLATFVFVTTNLLVDLVSGAVDPRVSVGAEAGR